jgi:hypothetical protein
MIPILSEQSEPVVLRPSHDASIVDCSSASGMQGKPPRTRCGLFDSLVVPTATSVRTTAEEVWIESASCKVNEEVELVDLYEPFSQLTKLTNCTMS